MLVDNLAAIARQIRFETIQISSASETPHLGSALSTIEILTALYFRILNIRPQEPQWPDRDIFVLSKGHAALGFFVTLAARGFFSKDLLTRYAQPGCPLEEHPSPGCVAGVECGTGSLGHGLSLGLGMAYGAALARRSNHTFVLLSDGECNEGSVWEAAMFAPKKGIKNVTAIIDFNKWQATDRSEDVLSLAPLADKWAAFGWRVEEIDGHDLPTLCRVLKPQPAETPLAVVAHTIKGKGISFMEDDNNWHYRIPTTDEVELCRKELFP